VLPLVPAYVGMLAGAEGEERPLAASSTAFVLGFATEFAAFGAIAGLAGSSFDSARGALQRIGGVAVLFFGLMLLTGLGTGSPRRLISRLPAVGHWARPWVMGVAFATAWTPCVGPLLGAALVLAARTSSALSGAVLLGAYAAGIGVPFVMVALAADAMPATRNRLRRWSVPISRVAAITMIVLGGLLALDRYSVVTNTVARLIPS
jgi:cytochrome c-type biogenesis protein